MKVGIMGLRPRQITDVAGRKFNGHELVFYKEKSYPAESVASFCRNVDRVLLIASGVPKSAIGAIPYLKRHQMNGSISTIIRYLETLPPAEEPVMKVKPAAVVTAAVEEAVVVEAPAEVMTSIIPDGYKSQYTWSPDETMIVSTAPSGAHRYDILDAAVPGDVLRFSRPADLAPASWRMRVHALRTYRLKKAQQVLEAHFFPEYVDILVMQQMERDGSIKPSKRVIKAKAPLAEMAQMEFKSDPKREDIGIIAQEVDPRAAAVEAAEALEPKPTSTPIERSFWRKVFVATVGDGSTSVQAGYEADVALKIYRERFQ